MSQFDASRPFMILVAADDGEDRELVRDALADAGFERQIRLVFDGQDLLDYRGRESSWAHPSEDGPRPGINLADLNMPKKDGRAALAEIKTDDSLRRIPAVVLTTSIDEADVLSTYHLGGNSFITKPATFTELVDVTHTWAPVLVRDRRATRRAIA